MNSLNVENTIGINTFFTNFPGIKGKLRFNPEDFCVREISNFPKEDEKGRFTIAEITVTNWETNRLIRELSNELHVSRKRISFAGTKDKRAKSTRLMSFHNITKNDLSNLKIKDVVIKKIYSSNRPVKIGDLTGNSFNIIIRDIDEDIKESDISSVFTILKNIGGFPNFYGVQRFGNVRPITHIVGKHIVCGDFEKAAMSYVANPMLGEDEETYKVREKLMCSYDFSEALMTYPKHLTFEKAILNKLVVDPTDFISALKELPKNLLTMFVYAYQSYLFNKILSQRIMRKIPLNKAIIGDKILPIRRGLIDEEEILVTEKNIEKINKQISLGHAFICGVLFGSDSEFSSGEIGEIEHKIIDEEKIDLRDFVVPEIPFISSYGSKRALIAPLMNLNYTLRKDSINKGKLQLNLKFDLNKGCYATSFLREIMKSDNIRNY